MGIAIATEGLSKHYGRLKAVDGVSLSVAEGEIYGFLGLNGAGKTTTIRMLLGMITPTSGKAFLCGQRVTSGNTGLWNSVGYLVEVPSSYPDLTLQENLAILASLRGLTGSKAVDGVVDRLNLGAYRKVLARKLSLGNAQRLGLAKALLHGPKILILDEPTNGLDPAGIVEVRQLLIGLARDHGVTIFISSHLLGELARFATRIAIIHGGRLLREESADDLETSRLRRLEMEVRSPASAREALEDAGFHIQQTGSTLWTDEKTALEAPDKVSALLASTGHPPLCFKVHEEDLETYFLRVTGKEVS